MSCPDLFGWKPLPVSKHHPQWDAVRSLRLPGAPDLPTPQMVDQWVNREVQYVPDHGDHWQAPLETLVRRQGDCEDIALLKRALLMSAGYHDKNIFLTIVHDLVTRQDHAVVVVDGYVLDSFNARTLPVEQVKDYAPVMAMAADKSWLFGRAG